VFDGKSELTIQQVRSEFDNHVCSEKYSEYFERLDTIGKSNGCSGASNVADI
jgi:hypothetical protein